jgi:hypothetical protein
MARRGLINLLIGLFAGAGVGLLVIEYFAYGKPSYWQGKDPPPGLFAGIGIGCLVSAIVWFLLFARREKGTPS